ncbi:septation ring formation regulator EzrA [Sediminibacillus massiliensis]|uniref:septation ring formation regulator EzrA n=1 Tax=Sediminibacillus massiliensis TaxID=1926277 RepID=UPI0009887632|nr:septation ring formation regulator EzrA [Sediminibacillus massiliensis]
MEYIIGGILIIIVLIIAGLIWRKKIYDEVDRLEGWKMDIMNRNVTSELSKVKNLNLSGETQERFESWKDRWDQILTKELPDLEEYLFDAEESADRYRISAAKKNLRNVEEELKGIEADIDSMFIELEQLLESEQSSREEVEELQPKIKVLRKILIQNRHEFGKAESLYESEINGMDEKMKQYNGHVEDGNYFEAQKLVHELKEQLSSLEEQIEQFPVLYRSCKKELPAQLNELLSGIKGMKKDGYHIDHLGFEKELHDHQLRVENAVGQLNKGSMEGVQELITTIEERIKEMYQLLEKEAIAKNYVEKHLPGYRKELENEISDFEETRFEVEDLQESYYFEDQDVEVFLTLQNRVKQLKDELEKMDEQLELKESTHIDIRESIESRFEELSRLHEQHEEFRVQIQTLRKEELEAKDQVWQMRKDFQDTQRAIQKSNIPGVPAHIWELLDTVAVKTEEVELQLEKHPLDMGEVQSALTEAEESTRLMIDQTEQLLDQAALVELVIQYANRYRSQHPDLASKLGEAETLFRDYEYEEALEHAAKALEEIEPGALKRLEDYRKVPS